MNNKFQKFLRNIPLVVVYLILFIIFYGFSNNFAINRYQNFSGIFSDYIYIALTLVFYFCVVMVLVCHILCTFCSPGIVEINNTYHRDNIELFCKKCDSNRPYRSHHCKICDRCIMKMDHHCPWINNCVGLKNQKYFFLFLLYSTLGCLISIISLWPNLLKMDLNVRVQKELGLFELIYLMRDEIITLLATLFSLFMFICIGFLLAIQFLNIKNDITSIEAKIYTDSITPWNIETDFKHNLKLVLGDSGLLWCLPVYNSKEMNYASADYNNLVDNEI
jgi:hypothetical protein